MAQRFDIRAREEEQRIPVVLLPVVHVLRWVSAVWAAWRAGAGWLRAKHFEPE